MQSAQKIARYLLELNVYNAADLTAQLQRIADRVTNPTAKDWLMRVGKHALFNIDQIADPATAASNYEKAASDEETNPQANPVEVTGLRKQAQAALKRAEELRMQPRPADPEAQAKLAKAIAKAEAEAKTAEARAAELERSPKTNAKKVASLRQQAGYLRNVHASRTHTQNVPGHANSPDYPTFTPVGRQGPSRPDPKRKKPHLLPKRTFKAGHQHWNPSAFNDDPNYVFGGPDRYWESLHEARAKVDPRKDVLKSFPADPSDVEVPKHEVQDRNLKELSMQHYDDPDLWPAIAAVNGLPAAKATTKLKDLQLPENRNNVRIPTRGRLASVVQCSNPKCQAVSFDGQSSCPKCSTKEESIPTQPVFFNRSTFDPDLTQRQYSTEPILRDKWTKALNRNFRPLAPSERGDLPNEAPTADEMPAWAQKGDLHYFERNMLTPDDIWQSPDLQNPDHLDPETLEKLKGMDEDPEGRERRAAVQQDELWPDMDNIANYFNWMAAVPEKTLFAQYAARSKTLFEELRVMATFDISGFLRILEEARNWRNHIASKPGDFVTDTKLVMYAGDGWSWKLLNTPEELAQESEVMGHCIGNTYHTTPMMRGENQVYSLRDPRDNAVITIEVKVAEPGEGRLDSEDNPLSYPIIPPLQINECKGSHNWVPDTTPATAKARAADFIQNYLRCMEFGYDSDRAKLAPYFA